jgi:hypothetical protein
LEVPKVYEDYVAGGAGSTKAAHEVTTKSFTPASPMG